MAVIQRKTWLASQLTPRKLTFYILFHGLHICIFILGWYLQASNKKLAALNSLEWSVWLSRGAGLNLSVDTTIILLPMCRNLLKIVRPKIRWLPLDESQWFHRQVAYSLVLWTVVHTAAHYVNFFNVERSQVRPEAAVQIHYTQAGGITGHVMLFCMLLMYTTSHAKIRQQSYETFWYTHHLFIPFLLALYTHATGCFVRDSVQPYSPFASRNFWNHCIGYEGWRWELVGGGIYLFERIWREVRARQHTEITKVVRHPYDAVEIQFRKPSMRYKAGQWLFMNVPSVSETQWHPFTITSCPHDPYISIHVRQVGDWTRALANALGAGSEQQKFHSEFGPEDMYEVMLQSSEEMPKIRIDGPYGAPAEDVLDNEIAVLVGTGIGVTPWASILKDIWHLRQSAKKKRLQRVEFIWICKDTTSFEWFQSLLLSLEQQSKDEAGGGEAPNRFLRISTYLTQKIDEATAHNIILNTVGAERDPLTKLSTSTNYGRPDFNKMLVGIREGILNQRYIAGLDRGEKMDVGVYFCGPNVGARDIKKACKEATVKQVKFKFWKEHF